MIGGENGGLIGERTHDVHVSVGVKRALRDSVNSDAGVDMMELIRDTID